MPRGLLDRPKHPGLSRTSLPPSNQPPPGVRDAVAALLDPGERHPQGAWEAAPGGLSTARVWRVEFVGRGVFAVHWRPNKATGPPAWAEALLRGACAAGLGFVAAPRWSARLPNGATVTVSDWKPGAPLNAASDPRDVAAAIEGLRHLHAWARRAGPDDDPLDPPADRSARVLSALEAIRATPPGAIADAWPEAEELRPRSLAAAGHAMSSLAALPPGVFALRQAVHGDARPEHFLLEGCRLTGLIDFAAVRIDTPLADVARLAGELAAGDADVRDAIVALYAEPGERSLATRAVAALDLSGAVIAAANWLRWLGEEAAARRDATPVRLRLRSISARLCAASSDGKGPAR